MVSLTFVSECDHGYYGVNCQQNCGHCSEASECHHITGECSDTCKPGYQGIMCNEGMNCSEIEILLKYVEIRLPPVSCL